MEERTRSWRKYFLAMLIALVTLLVAACGSGTAGDSGSGDTSRGASGPVRFEVASGYAEEPPQSLVDAAKKEDGLVWYESSTEEQVAKIFDAFQDKYPFVKNVEHVRLRASDVAARIAQEAQANAPTADVGTTDTASATQLYERQMLATPEWTKLGVPPELVPELYLVATAASVYVILYNTELVSEEEAPTSWEDLLDERWRGKIGTWVVPFAFVELVPVWGGDRTTEYVRQFAQQNPVTYESTFPLAQAVGAGEIPVGVGIYHATQPAIEAGAPIEIVVPRPTPVTMLYSFIPKDAANPNTAKLFISWLATEEGARAYEEATGRGNPLLPGTETAELVSDRTISDFPPSQAAETSEWLDRFARYSSGNR